MDDKLLIKEFENIRKGLEELYPIRQSPISMFARNWIPIIFLVFAVFTYYKGEVKRNIDVENLKFASATKAELNLLQEDVNQSQIDLDFNFKVLNRQYNNSLDLILLVK